MAIRTRRSARRSKQALEGGLNFGAHNATEARFAAAICARFPSIELVRFTNSGTEANLMAVSAARAITGRPKILVFDGGYHGGVFYFRGHGSALNAPFEYLLGRYNDLEAVEALVRAAPRRACGDPDRADAGHHAAASRPSASFSPDCARWRTRPGRC